MFHFKTLAAVAALSLGVAAAGFAEAATVLSWTRSDLGTAYTVDFAGEKGGVTIPGLAAEVVYTLHSVGNGGKTWVFDYSLLNTSTAPVTSSRVSGFGFDVNRVLASAGATGTFSAATSGNVPDGIGVRDVCVTSNNCAGGAGGGVNFGGAGAGTFTLNLKTSQASLALSDLYVRYQSINTKTDRSNFSGVGQPTDPGTSGIVPEPATWALMISGFGMAGVALRRRRAIAA